jgi:hypothetical protein
VPDSAPNNRPLAGLRVIDIATYIAAPYCATIMAEFGAEVIKVEQPKVGDPCRRLGTISECGDTLVWLSEASLAAADYASAQAMAQSAVPDVDADLHTRLKAQVETRAAICEQWLPLWRALLRYQSESEELAIRITRIRASMVARLELVYGQELSTLSEAERTQLLVVLDILTDFESWGRMREGHGLSIEAARDIWINAIERMLPTVALDPARSNPPASV